MAKIIDFEGSPVHRLRSELKTKDEEIEKLQNQLRATTQRLVAVISINDMLKLQLADLQTNLQYLRYQIASAENNVTNLRSKLPDLSGLQERIMSTNLKKKLEGQQEINLNDQPPAGLSFDIESDDKKDPPEE